MLCGAFSRRILSYTAFDISGMAHRHRFMLSAIKQISLILPLFSHLLRFLANPFLQIGVNKILILLTVNDILMAQGLCM